MSLRPRAEIEHIDLCPHGGPNYGELRQLGFDLSEVMDFSVSANPFGPPEGLREALASAPVDRYPDSESLELRQVLAEKFGVGLQNIIAGNGSMDIIRLVASAYLDREDAALIIGPTFGEYEIGCRIAGCRIFHYTASESNRFEFDVAEIVDLVRRHRPKVVFLCNPNNPTGRYLGKEEVSKILSACEGALLVLDEAYVAFTQNSWDSTELISEGDVLILRSMTKDYALAGLRLGYAMANTGIISTLRKVCAPWSVNVMAQQAGLVALGEESYLEKCLQGVRQASDYLRGEFQGLGLPPLLSDVHFFLVRVPDATEFRTGLLQSGIMVRDCTSFGLPHYVRISPRTLPECRRLIEVVSGVLR